MNLSRKSSITVAGPIPALEVKAAVLAYVRVDQGLVDGKNGVTIVSSNIDMAPDGSAMVEIVYEQADVPATTDDADAAPAKTAA